MVVSSLRVISNRLTGPQIAVEKTKCKFSREMAAQRCMAVYHTALKINAKTLWVFFYGEAAVQSASGSYFPIISTIK